VRRLTDILIFGLLLAAATVGGCKELLAPPGPPAVNFYLRNPADLQGLGQVAMVELPRDPQYAEISQLMTEALANGLSERRLFTVCVVRPADALYERMPQDCSKAMTLPQIAQLRQDLDCDAVLIGTITSYRPYPHMRIGLRLKLMDLRNGQLLWAVDEVWDTSEADVQRRLEKYFDEIAGKDYQPIGWRVALASPRAFVKFVAWEISQTLPGRRPSAKGQTE
jgi:hypothetical protein